MILDVRVQNVPFETILGMFGLHTLEPNFLGSQFTWLNELQGPHSTDVTTKFKTIWRNSI